MNNTITIDTWSSTVEDRDSLVELISEFFQDITDTFPSNLWVAPGINIKSEFRDIFGQDKFLDIDLLLFAHDSNYEKALTLLHQFDSSYEYTLDCQYDSVTKELNIRKYSHDYPTGISYTVRSAIFTADESEDIDYLVYKGGE